jgi:hypothetical protein
MTTRKTIRSVPTGPSLTKGLLATEHKGMYRVRLKSGCVSDILNLSRAKDLLHHDREDKQERDENSKDVPGQSKARNEESSCPF